MADPNQDWGCDVCLLTNEGSAMVCQWCTAERTNSNLKKLGEAYAPMVYHEQEQARILQGKLALIEKKYRDQAQRQAEQAQLQAQALELLQTKYQAQAQRQAVAVSLQQAQLESLKDKYANQDAEVQQRLAEREDFMKCAGRVFENALINVVCLHKFPKDRNPSWYLPRSVLALAEYLAGPCLMDDVFSAPGSKPEVRRLMQAMDDHEFKQSTKATLEGLTSRTEFFHVVSVVCVAELCFKSYSPPVLASVFRAFWAKLPQPLIPCQHYQSLITLKQRSEVVAFLYDREIGVPQANRSVMEALMDFCATLSLHSEINKSSVHVLASLLGPLLIRPPSDQAYQDAVRVLGGKEREAEARVQIIAHLIAHQASVRALEIAGR